VGTRLYVRIWLAIVLAVAALALLSLAAWRLAAEAPLNELVVRDETGQVVGIGEAHRPQAAADTPARDAPFGLGPEYVVSMEDGSVLHVHLPRGTEGPWRAPIGFAGMLVLVAIAVALATYPVVRRLTARLERLRVGVQRWGNGDLDARVALDGDDEIGFLAQHFNRAADQTQGLVHDREQLLLAQKSMLANASHELRSPLARIRMGVEMLALQETSAARAEITRNITELDHLIEEILLASRLEAREADLGTMEAVDLVGICAEECAHTGAMLETTLAELCVDGVARLLRRVVRNLLENAARYGGGDVTITLAREGASAVLRVLDSGPGVPVDQRLRIFEPFYRLAGASEHQGGVGLGLALVKSIVQRHGGTVQCVDCEAPGACFEVRLPASA